MMTLELMQRIYAYLLGLVSTDEDIPDHLRDEAEQLADDIVTEIENTN